MQLSQLAKPFELTVSTDSFSGKALVTCHCRLEWSSICSYSPSRGREHYQQNKTDLEQRRFSENLRTHPWRWLQVGRCNVFPGKIQSCICPLCWLCVSVSFTVSLGCVRPPGGVRGGVGGTGAAGFGGGGGDSPRRASGSPGSVSSNDPSPPLFTASCKMLTLFANLATKAGFASFAISRGVA